MPQTSLATTPLPRPGSWGAWRIALRPKTLWIATIPVIAGTCLAWSVASAFDPVVALIALAASVLMQVITNLQNDVGYTERGGETGTRVGLPRATATGLLGVRDVKRAIVAAMIVAQVVALPLMIRGGAPIVATSLASTIAAYAYMGGPRPIAYTPYGELTVFAFFGLVAVCGTYYVQSGAIDVAAWIVGAALGAHAAGVLLVNNFRDRAHDATTGRRTLPVVIGAAHSAWLYALLELAPFALAALLAARQRSFWYALPLTALPWAARLVRDFTRLRGGAAQSALLFRTVMLEVAFGMLLSVGALLDATLH